MKKYAAKYAKAVECLTKDRDALLAFTSPRQAQQFLSAHGPIYQHYHPCRHLMTAVEYRAYRADAFAVWQQETCVRKAP